MRVVLDSNIYLSALISEKGNPFKIIQRWQEKEFDVLVSQPIINEILRVTAYERIQKKYPRVKERRIEFVELVSKDGIWTTQVDKLDVVTADESDNRYIECAVAGNAEYIVTGDQHLLVVGGFQGIVITTPTVFLTLLDSDLN